MWCAGQRSALVRPDALAAGARAGHGTVSSGSSATSPGSPQSSAAERWEATAVGPAASSAARSGCQRVIGAPAIPVDAPSDDDEPSGREP